MLPRIFRGIYHFTVYAIGILVLTTAVAVTIIRLLLPDIGVYRGEVEAWVSRYMGYPVVIRTIDATWEGWVPYLELSNIDLLNRAGTQPITHFQSAQIRIAPLDTLLKRRIVPKQLTINGFELAIVRLASGAIYIEGINVSAAQADNMEDNELAEWLFRQEQIGIEDARIEWIDMKHEQQPILMTDVSLKLRSDGKRLQAEGSTKLPEIYGNTMDFAFDARGNLLSSDWSGQLYLAGRDINPDHWYRDSRPWNVNVSGGTADIRVWSTWRRARLDRLEGELKYRDFSTSAGDSELHIDQLAYRFFGERIREHGWQFRVNLNQLRTANGNWPEANIVVTATRAGREQAYRYSTSFDYVKLDDLSPFLRNLTFLPDATRSRLSNLSIQGELHEGKLIYDPGKEAGRQLQFDTRFSRVDAEPGPDLPSLANLSGHLYGYLDRGAIALDTDNTVLKLDLFENDTLDLNRLRGRVLWSRNAGGWKLGFDNLRVESADLSADLSGRIRKLGDDESPFFDILVKLHSADLESIPAYLPYTERFKLRKWMKRSVLGGKLISARAVLRGYLADFPFDDHEGRFVFIADTSGGTLDYSQHWPPVDNIDAEIFIDGREMTSNSRHGRIFDASITDANANMADILKKKKSIGLKGHVRGVTRDLSLFIAQSPLQKNPAVREVGESLRGGNIDMDLDLFIPLKQPDIKPRIAGNLDIRDGILKSKVRNLVLTGVTGGVSFTRTSVDSKKMTAAFAGKAVDLNISGSSLEPDNPPSLKITGQADQGFVADRLMEYFPPLKPLEHYFRNRMEGEAEWSVTMATLPPDEENRLVKRLEVESLLQGMAIDFPAPLGKAARESVPLKITSWLGPEKPRDIVIEYGNEFEALLERKPDRKLKAIRMHVGGGPAADSDSPGLHIAGNINELVATQWWNVIKERDKSRNQAGGSLLDAGVYVDLHVDSLELLNHRFPEVALKLRRPGKHWHFSLEGSDIAGNCSIPVDRRQDNLVTFKLDRLVMTRRETQQAGVDRGILRPADIPAIEGRVTEFVYNDFELGKMELQTMPVINGMSIETITFNKPGLNISGSGDWIGDGTEESSIFDISLHADEMDRMLTTFDYNQTPVKHGETNLHLNAQWQGSPMDFSLAEMNGTLEMQISKGQMLDINPAAGRLFGLFSLQTLSRRLTLDFSDIFGKGLAFDHIEGSFDIDGGNAYTNDLYMRGPSANIAVSGRTGLSDKDYDQIVTVIPQFSDNLPVAGVLLGPVGIGIGAVFYLAGQMFDSVHDSVDRLLEHQYTITGSWNDPVIKKIKDKKGDQQISEAAG